MIFCDFLQFSVCFISSSSGRDVEYFLAFTVMILFIVVDSSKKRFFILTSWSQNNFQVCVFFPCTTTLFTSLISLLSNTAITHKKKKKRIMSSTTTIPLCHSLTNTFRTGSTSFNVSESNSRIKCPSCGCWHKMTTISSSCKLCGTAIINKKMMIQASRKKLPLVNSNKGKNRNSSDDVTDHELVSFADNNHGHSDDCFDENDDDQGLFLLNGNDQNLLQQHQQQNDLIISFIGGGDGLIGKKNVLPQQQGSSRSRTVSSSGCSSASSSSSSSSQTSATHMTMNQQQQQNKNRRFKIQTCNDDFISSSSSLSNLFRVSVPINRCDEKKVKCNNCGCWKSLAKKECEGVCSRFQ